MFLKLADKLVKQGDYVGALQAIAKAKEAEPSNRYATAYEERVRMLLRESGPSAPSHVTPTKKPGSSVPPVQKGADGMPSAEKQINSIATLLQKSQKKPPASDPRNAAIQKKVGSLLSSANQLLSQERFAEALDTVARAILLDADNREIKNVEERIRAALEESRRRATRQLQEREHEDTIRRERLLQEEVDRLKKEQERKREQEESQRRSAQEQKVAQSLQRTRDFLTAGLFEEARCELAFVSVLAPGLADVQALDAEIAFREQEREHEAEEARQHQREEEREHQLRLRSQIEEAISKAEALAREGTFDEALRILTDAYLLDPDNAEIEACEERIVSTRAAHAQKLERERRERDEALARTLEEERKREQEAERARIRKAELLREQEQRRVTQEQIANHLHAARAYLAGERFKDALAEVALAFILDPFHAEVKEMERTIMECQLQQHHKPEPPPASEPHTDDDADLEAIAKHLAEAKRLASEHRFFPALYEIRKALDLDPENIAAKKLASAFREEFARSQEELRKSSKKSGSSTAPAESSPNPPVNAGFGPEVDFVDQLIRDQIAEMDRIHSGEQSRPPLAILKRWWVRALVAVTVGALLYVATTRQPDRPTSAPAPTQQIVPAEPAAGEPEEFKTADQKKTIKGRRID